MYIVFIAFDADHTTNPHVCRQLARLIAQRIEDTRPRRPSLTTKVLTWNGPKGIDDAVRTNVKLSTLSIKEWQATLENDSLGEMTKFWEELGFTP
jgi:hypothetical protein